MTREYIDIEELKANLFRGERHRIGFIDASFLQLEALQKELSGERFGHYGAEVLNVSISPCEERTKRVSTIDLEVTISHSTGNYHISTKLENDRKSNGNLVAEKPRVNGGSIFGRPIIASIASDILSNPARHLEKSFGLDRGFLGLSVDDKGITVWQNKSKEK